MTNVTATPRPQTALARPRRTAWRRPGAAQGDEGAALLTVLLAMLMAASMSVLVLGAVLVQARPTQVERKAVGALHASEAGVDVALNRIRAATKADALVSTAVVGDLTKLPCAASGPALSGAVGGQPGNLTYAVAIRYYTVDPAGKDATWRAANAMACPLPAQPYYALIESVGSGDAVPGYAAALGNRSVESVYSFRVGNVQPLGGQISVNGLCWDAGNSTKEGAWIKAHKCDPDNEAQRFSWRDDLTLVLSSSLETKPLCITADVVANSTKATLEACDGLLHQMWGVDDSARFYAYIDGGAGKWCAQGNGAQAQGMPIVSGTSCKDVFTIDQSVGSGRSGSPSASQPGKVMHWVNYAEYGRCLDINNWTVSRHLILYPCKQDPLTPELRWNQGFLWDGPNAAGVSKISTFAGVSGQDYVLAQAAGAPKVCLQSSATAGVPLSFAACSTAQPLQNWVVNRDTGSYWSGYTIVDVNGRCLTSGAKTSDTGKWSSVRVLDCDGSDAQKWNAPPDFTSAERRSFRETTAG
jgi:hypothetical protein